MQAPTLFFATPTMKSQNPIKKSFYLALAAHGLAKPIQQNPSSSEDSKSKDIKQMPHISH